MLDNNYPEFTFCIENDYPCYSFGSLLGDYVSQFDHSICLDTGHLFASCVLFKLDFLEQARKILETKNVKCVHFHQSVLKKDSHPYKIHDGHQNLYIKSELPLKELLKIMFENNVDDFIFEVDNGNLKDFETFINWKNEILGK